SVRLCKGIYVEPPELAYQDFDDVRASYVRALEALLDAGSYVGIATHDEWLLDEGRRLVAERGLSRDEYEFQMLLGVRPALGDELVREGHRLRIYVPFGRHWYAYSLRRLQENPKIAGYIAADAPDEHEDPADDVDVDRRVRVALVDGEGEDGAHGDQDQADGKTHWVRLPGGSRCETGQASPMLRTSGRRAGTFLGSVRRGA